MELGPNITLSSWKAESNVDKSLSAASLTHHRVIMTVKDLPQEPGSKKNAKDPRWTGPATQDKKVNFLKSSFSYNYRKRHLQTS